MLKTSTWIVVACALLCSGCLYSREIVYMRREIQREVPDAHFEREVLLSLGPGSIRVLSWLTGFFGDEDVQMAHDYLRDIRRVKVGVYDVENLVNEDVDLSRLERFVEENWEVAVKAREEQGVIWVLYNERHGVVRDLYVMVLDDQDLVMARIQGNLSRLLQRVIEDHSDLFHVVRRNS